MATMADQTIKLTITSVQNSTYRILLKKCFGMVFIDENGKKLDLFLATVFGGFPTDSKKEIPTYQPDIPARLRFAFEIQNSARPKSAEFHFSDITDSFLKQSNLFEKFWGRANQLGDENGVLSRLRECYSSFDFSVGTNLTLPMDLPFCFIQDKRSSDRCVVTKGEFSQIQNPSAYELSSQAKISCPGIEYINWIRCEAEIEDTLLQKKLDFSVSFNGVDRISDFTWYFAPPVEYCVDTDSASLSYGTKEGQSATEEKNKISGVADHTTVPFEEWLKLGILDRAKSRVLLDKNTNFMSIEVKLSIEAEPHSKSIRQFFIGLLAALTFSFFADQTRVQFYCETWTESLLQLMRAWEYCLSVFLPIMAFLSFVSILYHFSRKGSEKCKGLFWAGIVVSLIAAAIFIFVPVLRTVFPWFEPSHFVIDIILFGCIIASYVLNLIYSLRNHISFSSLRSIL